jgi:hypothetical protein
LEECPLSFAAVATCPDVRGSVDDAATTRRVVIIPVATCPSCGLTGVEGRGLGGVNHGVISLCSREYALERRFVRRAGLDRAYSASMGDIVTSSSSPCCYGRRCRDLTPVIPGLSG